MRLARHRMLLLAIAAIFAAPFVLALALYHDAGRHPRGGLQHGELLLPLRPLIPPPLTASDGTARDAAAFHGRWTLLFSSGQRCETDCRQLLTILQNVRLAQGQAMARVQRVLVLVKPPRTSEVGEIGKGAGDLRVMTAARWPLASGYVFLLDPQGNLIMRYPPGFEPRGLLLDLQRLLRQSGAE